MRLPQLHDDLVAAAARCSRRGWRPARWTLACAAALVLAAGGTAGAVLTGTVGGRPSLFAAGPGPAPEPQLELTTAKLVLGVGQLLRAGRWELVGHRYRRRGAAEPDGICLDVVLVERGMSYGCGNPTTRTQGVTLGPDGVQLTGATTHPDVAAIRVHFRSRGTPVVRAASLVHVPADIAAKAGIDKAFSFYVAELPGGAGDLVAEALDARGRRLWRAECAMARC